MAQQSGLLQVRGTVQGLTFYRLEGNYYVRQKSSLTGRRVKTDPAFAPTMTHAGQLAAASRLAAQVYRQVEKAGRPKGLFRRLVGIAKKALAEGRDAADVLALLEQQVAPPEHHLPGTGSGSPAKSNCCCRQPKSRCQELVAAPVRGLWKQGKPPWRLLYGYCALGKQQKAAVSFTGAAGSYRHKKRPDRHPASCKIQYPMKNRGQDSAEAIK